jgi:hypothetical protein
MTVTMNVREAKVNLSRLLKAVEDGEEVIIERRDPGTVTRFKLELAAAGRPVVYGVLKGRWPGDYDDAFSDRSEAEVAAAMFGEDR